VEDAGAACAIAVDEDASTATIADFEVEFDGVRYRSVEGLHQALLQRMDRDPDFRRDSELARAYIHEHGLNEFLQQAGYGAVSASGSSGSGGSSCQGPCVPGNHPPNGWCYCIGACLQCNAGWAAALAAIILALPQSTWVALIELGGPAALGALTSSELGALLGATTCYCGN
jgi:hypothetical protein